LGYASRTMYAVVERGMAVPPSRQIAAALRDRIRSGEYPSGSALPTILELAAEFRVTSNTTRKALGILKDEGLIESVPGYGTFVRS
jgi:DNA-binding GntR family transcriptional regulator